MHSITDLPNRRRLAGDTQQDGDALFGVLFNHASIGFAVTDPAGCFQRVNPALCKMLGCEPEDLLGRRLLRIIAPNHWRRLRSTIAEIRSGKTIHVQLPFDCLDQKGNLIHSLVDLSLVADADNVARYLIVQVNDNSCLVHAKKELAETQKRHQALLDASSKASEKELKERTESLSEVNTALEVLLRKRDADRMDVEDKMLSNAKNLILPYLEKLKASRLDNRQRVYLNLVESNLNELISPLSQRMARHYLNFTPLEIQVADLVKEGKTTKDIAHILRLSVRTIEAVRYTIRRKLGLKKKRANLRSHLLSIDGSEIARKPEWSG